VLALAVLMLVWLTLGWVGRWLGLRMKHPGFAPVVALAWMFIPPILLFTAACIIGDKLNLDRLPDRQGMPLMMWVTTAIAVGHCLIMAIWAITHLRFDFRTIVIEPISTAASRVVGCRVDGPWCELQLEVRACVSVVVAVCFLRLPELAQPACVECVSEGIETARRTLDLSKLMPAAIPDAENFARSAAFRDWQSGTNTAMKRALDTLQAMSPGAKQLYPD
jgi:hypothetical protein